jgi:hypothetical protein
MDNVTNSHHVKLPTEWSRHPQTREYLNRPRFIFILSKRISTLHTGFIQHRSSPVVSSHCSRHWRTELHRTKRDFVENKHVRRLRLQSSPPNSTQIPRKLSYLYTPSPAFGQRMPEIHISDNQNGILHLWPHCSNWQLLHQRNVRSQISQVCLLPSPWSTNIYVPQLGNKFSALYGAVNLLKLKLFLYLTNEALRHEGVCGSECIDPRFLDLGTSWSWVVGFTP